MVEGDGVKSAPMMVRKSRSTTAGPIKGKISENVEANITAKMQHAVA